MKTKTTRRQKRHGGTRAEVRNLPDCVNCGGPIAHGMGYESEVDADGKCTVRHAVRLYFDECVDTIPKKLREMGFCVEHPLPKGTPDTEWLAYAGQRGCSVITRDARIARNPNERQAVIDNDVKCFILPPTPKNAWDMIRDFVTMWEKIRVESAFPGPFIWKCNDSSSPVRWELLYPEEVGYVPIDLARTPTGHLLNLFADVVHMHDNGWFGRDFVEGLHENIRCELEARISRDRSKALELSPEWQRLHGQHISPELRNESRAVDLDEPINMGQLKVLLVGVDTESGTYQWIIPPHIAGDNVTGPGDTSGDYAYAFEAGPLGFHRSGFGLRVKREKSSRSRGRPDYNILSILSREFDALGNHLEIATDQWHRAQAALSSPVDSTVESSDLYDAFRMRCVWIQEHIQAVHQIHGSFWKDYGQELALEMRPIHAVLANGHQIDNTELDQLAEEVIKPLHRAVKHTRFADPETVADCLREARAQTETTRPPAGLTIITMHDGEPIIFRSCFEVDADGIARGISFASSKEIDGHVKIQGMTRK